MTSSKDFIDRFLALVDKELVDLLRRASAACFFFRCSIINSRTISSSSGVKESENFKTLT